MHNKLKTKVNKLDKKSPGATNLIHIDEYKTDKQNLKKNLNMLIQKLPDVSNLKTATVLN